MLPNDREFIGRFNACDLAAPSEAHGHPPYPPQGTFRRRGTLKNVNPENWNIEVNSGRPANAPDTHGRVERRAARG